MTELEIDRDIVGVSTLVYVFRSEFDMHDAEYSSPANDFFFRNVLT
jgi:hypothetical protein